MASSRRLPRHIFRNAGPPGRSGIAIARAARLRYGAFSRSDGLCLAGTRRRLAGITDWLVKPFTVAQARSKIGAWLLRTACQSIGNDVSAAAKEPVPPLAEVLQAKQVMADETTVLRATSEEGPRHLPERGSQVDKSALLWMYCREIAPFETAAFNSMAGDIIARAKIAPRRGMKRAIAARR